MKKKPLDWILPIFGKIAIGFVPDDWDAPVGALDPQLMGPAARRP